MKQITTGLALAFTVMAVAACDTTSPAVTDSALVGDFEADAIRFVSEDDPAVQLDLAEQFRSEINLRDDGTFQSRLEAPSGAVSQRTGTFTSDGTTATFSESPFAFSDIAIENPPFQPSAFEFHGTQTGTTLRAPGGRVVFQQGAAPTSAQFEMDLRRR